MSLMALGPMLMKGGGRMGSEAASVGSNASAAMEDLDGSAGVARFEVLTDQLIGHAVVMPLDLDVMTYPTR